MTPAGPGRVTRFDPPADPVLRVGAVQHVPQVGLVEIVLGAADTGGVFDVVDALIEPGGSWAAHRHAFAEWFRVLDGELELLAPRAGRLARWRASRRARPAPCRRGRRTPSATRRLRRPGSSSSASLE